MGFLATIGLGTVFGHLFNQGGGGIPQVQPPQATQAAQQPSAATVRGQVGAGGAGGPGGAPGVAQTFLSGAGGVDPSLLNLGRATLLGGGTAPTRSSPGMASPGG